MLRGYYTAASGMVTQEKKLNNIGQNITNASSAGYKKNNIVEGTFGEHIAVRMNAYMNRGTVDIGKGVYMQTAADEYTDYTQGGLTFTERPMDMAIMGNGFFVVADAEGNEYLTRDGQFSLDAEGYLVLPGFGRVQGDGGDIYIGISEFSVDRTGMIYLTPPGEEPVEVSRLSIAIPGDYDAMSKAANGMFITEDYDLLPETGSPDTAVIQGRLESSNVNMAEEMARMIASQRTFQSCSQIVKMYDELSDQINSRISRIQ